MCVNYKGLRPFFLFIFGSMKPKQTALKQLLGITLLFFVILNTAYYWEGTIGDLALLLVLVLALSFVVLLIVLSYQVYYIIKDKFRNRLRNYTFATLVVVLILTIYKPYGIIDFESLEGEDNLIAYREGVASCRITFKLKDTGRFYMREACFGIEETRGHYEIKGDSILLSDISSRGRTLGYGIIEGESIVLYKSFQDLNPLKMSIYTNHLKKDVVAK